MGNIKHSKGLDAICFFEALFFKKKTNMLCICFVAAQGYELRMHRGSRHGVCPWKAFIKGRGMES
jgi:hypothetical protein